MDCLVHNTEHKKCSTKHIFGIHIQQIFCHYICYLYSCFLFVFPLSADDDTNFNHYIFHNMYLVCIALCIIQSTKNCSTKYICDKHIKKYFCHYICYLYSYAFWSFFSVSADDDTNFNDYVFYNYTVHNQNYDRRPHNWYIYTSTAWYVFKSRLLFSSAEIFKKPLWQTVWTQIRLLL